MTTSYIIKQFISLYYTIRRHFKHQFYAILPEKTTKWKMKFMRIVLKYDYITIQLLYLFVDIIVVWP